MKIQNLFISGLVILCSILPCSAEIPAPPFQKGVNLAGWFQGIHNAAAIQFTRFTREDLENIQSLGCDHIRLPLELISVTGPVPDHTIEPLFFRFLDQVIDWAEELDLHLILDNHSFDPSVDTSQEILDSLIPIWTQIAERYKHRSNLIYYEILNEPHGISDSKWNGIQQQVIDAIRGIDSTHTLVVGPASWNSYDNLKYMPAYPDSNLIYTFHFYDPFLFTHQGASWTEPSMENIGGIPYPYDAESMPGLPAGYQGTWIGSEYQLYSAKGNDTYVRSLINRAIQFAETRQVPLWCGEFGAYIPNSSTEARARWHETVRSYLEEKGIAWSLWEYSTSFGIFEPGSNGQFKYDVNIPIIEALGLTPPPQEEYVLRPDSAGFVLYDDYPGEAIVISTWVGDAVIDYYSGKDPSEGEYCITWEDAAQYNTLSFQFTPVKDLTRLIDEDYRLEFKIRGSVDNVRIDVRFMDTDTEDPEDHPWRMRTTIDNSLIEWDGSWQTVRILLEDFAEMGAWESDTWYNPRGDFDWSQAANLDFVSEYSDLKGVELAFDDIRITSDSDPSVISPDRTLPHGIELYPSFPNPFNARTAVSFSVPAGGMTILDIINTAGQRVDVLADSHFEAGSHRIIWDGSGFSSGVYMVRLRTESGSAVKRMILMK